MFKGIIRIVRVVISLFVFSNNTIQRMMTPVTSKKKK